MINTSIVLYTLLDRDPVSKVEYPRGETEIKSVKDVSVTTLS